MRIVSHTQATPFFYCVDEESFQIELSGGKLDISLTSAQSMRNPKKMDLRQRRE